MAHATDRYRSVLGSNNGTFDGRESGRLYMMSVKRVIVLFSDVEVRYIPPQWADF